MGAESAASRMIVNCCDNYKVLIVVVYLLLFIARSIEMDEYEQPTSNNIMNSNQKNSSQRQQQHSKSRRASMDFERDSLLEELYINSSPAIQDSDQAENQEEPKEVAATSYAEHLPTRSLLLTSISSSSGGATDGRDENNTETREKELDEIVRSQLDLGASDWATMSPSDHRANLDEHLEQLSQLTGPQQHTERVAKLLDQNKPATTVEHKLFYPNHNYQFDQESSEPFRESHSQQTAQTGDEGKTTVDPMTTSSTDGSKKYEPQPPSYLYRLRGPITATSSVDISHNSDVAKSYRFATPTKTTTLAPKIILALQKLDERRRRPNPQNNNRRTPTTIPHQEQQQHLGSALSSNRINYLFSQGDQPPQVAAMAEASHGRPHGFMDEPTLTIVSTNNQQPPIQSHVVVDPKPPPAAHRTNQGKFPSENYRNTQFNGAQIGVPTAAPSLEQQIVSSNSTNGRNDKRKFVLNFVRPEHQEKDDYQRWTTTTTTTRISPQDLASNLNGNLAARLSANRNKNQLGPRTTTPTINMRAPDDIDAQQAAKAQPLSVGDHDRSRSSMGNQGEIVGSASTTHPTTSATAMAAATDPSTTTAGSNKLAQTTAGWRQTTIPLSAATSNPRNLLAEKSGGDFGLLNPAAHHHHLHSHVHSIKPALISIPVQQVATAASSSLGSSHEKSFNPYDGIVAAAAAAAAAATATARARSPLAVAAQQLAPAARPQVKTNLRPLKQSGLRKNSPNSHRIASASIPIGGTLASAMLQQSPPPSQYQSNSIIGQLLDSANRALRHMTGAGGHSQKAAHNNLAQGQLQAASSNQATPVHSAPATSQHELAGLFANLNQRATNHQLNPLFVDSAAAAAAAVENLAEFNVGSTEPAEPVGLFQAPIGSTGAQMDAYLASLISASFLPQPNEMNDAARDHEQAAQFSQLELFQAGLVANTTNDSSLALDSDWADSANNQLNNDSTRTNNLSDSGEIVFGSLGDYPELLYPISMAAAGSSTDQSESITTHSDPAGMQLDEQHFNFSFFQPESDLLENQYWPETTTKAVQNPFFGYRKKVQVHPVGLSSQGEREAAANHLPERANKKQTNMKTRIKKVIYRKQPSESEHHESDRPLAAHEPGSSTGLQYALTHYINEQATDDSSHLHFNGGGGGDLAVGKTPMLAYDVYDDSGKPVKFSQPAGSSPLSAQGSREDAFRPIIHPRHYYATYAGNQFKSGQPADQHRPAAGRPLMVSSQQQPPPGRYPRGQAAHQSQRPQHQRLFAGSNSSNIDKGISNNTSGLVATTTPKSGASKEGSTLPLSGSLYQASPPSWPHYAAALAMHHHHDLHHRPSGAGTSQLSQSSSSQRPNVAAMLASDLAALHRMHGLQHHQHSRLKHHRQHDLATSETAHQLGVSPPLLVGGTALLLHFWPLALALLPVMIVVAIVAQLVMAAPLLMFASATLAISRLLASPVLPLKRTDDRIDSILQAVKNEPLSSSLGQRQRSQLFGGLGKIVATSHSSNATTTMPPNREPLSAVKSPSKRRRRSAVYSSGSVQKLH